MIEGVIEILIPDNPFIETIYGLTLACYVMILIMATRRLYRFMVERGVPPNSAIYYNRKILHAAGGGLVAVLTPIIFTSPIIPSIASLAMATLLAVTRKLRLMWWFQVKDNFYEVNFNVAWGLSLLLLWIATGDPWIAVLPALYISLGDAATGVVRNMLFSRRTKHVAGNIAMALVVVPLSFAAAGPAGAIIGLVASAVEKLEFGWVDDNLLIAGVSTLLILAAASLGVV